MVAVTLVFVRVFPTLHRRAARPRGAMSPAPGPSTCWIWASCSARPSLAPTFPSTHRCCLSCACHRRRRAGGWGGPAVPLTLTSEQGAAFQSGRALENVRGTLGRGGRRSCSVAVRASIRGAGLPLIARAQLAPAPWTVATVPWAVATKPRKGGGRGLDTSGQRSHRSSRTRDASAYASERAYRQELGRL